MTEWIATEIIVDGKRKDLERFKNDVSEDGASEEENSVFSFNKIIPMPGDVSAWDKEGKGEGWYYWQEEHWGVKWGTLYASVDDKGKYLFYLFENPWGPATPIFETLTEKYPTLNFQIITYTLEDWTMFEMKSNKGNLLKYTIYYCDDYRSNGIPKTKWYEYDLIKNTKEERSGPKHRHYRSSMDLEANLALF